MKHVVYALALFATSDPAIAQTGVTGTWQVEGVGPMPAGQVLFPWEVVLRANGPGLTGAVSSCPSPRPFVEISEGRLDGSTITFTCRSQGGFVTILFTGTINGDEIAFTWTLQTPDGSRPNASNGMFGPLAPSRFIAKRVLTPDDKAIALAALVDRSATFVRGSEFAAAVNLLQKDVKVEGRLFVPQNVKDVRAVIVATAWGPGFNFYDDPQVQRLLETTESSLVVAEFSSMTTANVATASRTAIFSGADGLVVLLQRLAQESGHPELANAPLLFLGHSESQDFGKRFAALHPLRTIAVVGYQAGGPQADVKALSQVPFLLLAAGKDSQMSAGRVETFWKSGRAVGAPWTFAVQPDATHSDEEHLKKADDLVVPWIAAVLRQRLSPDGGRLRAVTNGASWLGNNRTGEVASYGMFSGPKAVASWLPDEPSAKAWRVVLGVAK